MVDAGTVSSVSGAGFKQRALGVGLVVLSTIAIALVPSLAKLAYEGGSNTLSVITGRSIFSVLITLALLVAFRQPMVIPRRPMRIALAMGVAYAVMLYGYLGAVNYLPVSLVILIYFVHPVLVGFIVMFLGQEKLTIISIGELAAALVGLYLAIGLSFEGLSGIGLALAALAMAVTAIIVVCGARATAEAKAISVGFYMMLSAAVALTVIFALFGTLALPTTPLAWTGFVGVAVASTVGTLAFISGMAYVGAARAAMISNLEPVLGVLFAIAVLGERVSLLQGTGIAIVIGAIFVMEMRR
ncbi:DMT family transporter [Mesorhizobium sp. M2D.F.Ca.ET.185.01.1.1]|uniref:DMT family transporter n=1 Tax=unclassified Mesorhizobium TaxID=325217 RepID=UPI000FCBF76D|nr:MULTISPECIES: DMT family transporter [unclassified Mesorhizobium]TGP77187.1 DMT family transporter [bacterium M00.F.Ca.ET.227.01.1.1]TGP84557.1 DMT family transporter [bacterium M00.F.Ca.ET.221.01.1.1]TGP88704.1 DMT family transporter [bacterium M00.F.Ca.ET.222.01.1.1]TGT98169.1 DMT family transporter [bacterium M00.F.Ca.ET.163.01.1.1]TGU30935.1 DMT family transporter [bacterium M00.F.Ca.ET.156.01.1.1]TGU45191.1 DMT family transporter [bacterium M00.F.Ca.ET.146.01.1.1]TGV65531.1 DMT famil